ncbi:hypothetical protein, partial [Streptomyces sp. NPDC059009]|uniref:hypothetical protein n=1 Tax=Streptomyces sp. NPDC059009 TaxID=3346694 RepID=UPI0036B348BC
IFGTLLSSQGTDASFVLTLSGFPPGASLRYFVFPTLPDPFSVPFPVRSFISGGRWRAFAFRLIRLYQKFSAGLTGLEFPIYREWLLDQ